MKYVFLFKYALLGTLGLCAWGIAAQDASARGPSLRDLAPIQLYAVPELPATPAVPLPDPGLPAPAAAADVVGDNVPLDLSTLDFSPTLSSGRLSGPWQSFDGMRLHTGLHWSQTTRLSDASNGIGSLSVPDITDTWSYGTENWRYTGSGGLGLTLGNDTPAAPAWSDTARLGGIGLQRSPAGDPWQYSMMVGALDYSPVADDTATGGGLVYGPTASNTTVQYALNPRVTVESQVQWAPDLLTTGIGGKYSAGDWGVWDAGVAKASQAMESGWRYQLGYSVDVMNSVQLSWVNEQRSGGFSDLSTYRDFAPDMGQSRNRWGVSLPMGHWGDLSGTYEQIEVPTGPTEQRFGVSQQFWYSPHLNVQLSANREVISGDYDVGVHFSVPIN